MAVYVSKDGKTRVELDDADRLTINQYKAQGYRPEGEAAHEPAHKAEEADQ